MLAKGVLFGVKTKMILTFTICIIIPGIVFFVFFLQSYSSYVLDNVIENKENIMKEAQKNMEFRFEAYKNTSMTLYYNEAMKAYINQEEYAEENPLVNQFLSSIVNSDRYIAAAVLRLGDRIYGSGYSYQNLEDYFVRHEQDILAQKGRAMWNPTEVMTASYNQTPDNFSLGRAVNSELHNVGSFWIFFSSEIFNNIFKNSIFHEESTDYYMISEDYQIITSSNKEMTGSRGEEGLCRRAWETGNGNFLYEDEGSGKEKIVVCSYSDMTDWLLITVTDKSTAFKDVTEMKKASVIIGSLYVLFILIAYCFFSKEFFGPMKKLSRKLYNVTERKFEKIEETGRTDEMGMLMNNYNYMVDEIQALIENIREEEKAKNEEKMKVLSMQIGPHFIYNTLNTIKWMAVVNRQDNIKRMVESLVKLMMSVTYNNSEEITLKEEKALLESYVYIQKMRFTNFDVEYELPEEIQEFKILKLLLQPFVENCILHAFKGKAGVGQITIRFYEKGGVLEIDITDNGLGFDPDAITKNGNEKNEIDHVGICNVIERIWLNYGKEYGVTIDSAAGMGTAVHLHLPVICGGGEKNGESSDSRG
ncbi:cache domain-containing sensor histidine kinase [Murimonas intestini]|uniref:Histidine kinase n=1 Tax=Murimonas intestini TaxID=1337051 RepID=A0AB73T2X0_9FIRM|nr:sensor histidine kinase [Murimonas intestini]MCR1841724.1 histidine kinase [Murimonas intestini]MCR1865541.1 histidine kinase [Murimonas intestini]MCR1883878.1 histidine kinase [Murimonas intestini]